MCRRLRRRRRRRRTIWRAHAPTNQFTTGTARHPRLNGRLDGHGGLGTRLGRLLLGFVDNRLAAQSLGIAEATYAVCLRVLNARGVTLDTDLEFGREVDDNGVVDSKLSSELINPDLLRRQRVSLSCLVEFRVSCALPAARGLPQQCRAQTVVFIGRRRCPKGTVECPPSYCSFQAVRRARTKPCPTTRLATTDHKPAVCPTDNPYQLRRARHPATTDTGPERLSWTHLLHPPTRRSSRRPRTWLLPRPARLPRSSCRPFRRRHRGPLSPGTPLRHR